MINSEAGGQSIKSAAGHASDRISYTVSVVLSASSRDPSLDLFARFRTVSVDRLYGNGVSGEQMGELEARRRSQLYRSSSHPYALGVSLMTVCRGNLT